MLRKPKVSPFAKQCFVTAAVCFNIISYGCMFGYMAILLPQLQEPGSGFQLSQQEESWLASINVLFILVGSFTASPFMDRLGRKKAHLLLTIPFIVGWLLTVLATNIKVLLIARAILGVSGGQLNNLRSVLIGEYTSPKNRGAFLATISLTQGFGIFLVHLLGSFFSWQLTALICSFFPFISLVMIIYTPESPSWLAGQGRYDECSYVFRWLRGEEEEEELAELITARIELGNLKLENRQINSWLRKGLETIVKKEFFKPVILMIHTQGLMHFSGGTTIAVYSIVILNLIMGPTANLYFWMVFLDIQRLFTNTLAIYVMKRIKRRTISFNIGALCVIIQLTISIYVYGKSQGWLFLGWDGVWLTALLVNIHIFTLGMGMVPIPNILAGEVLPLEYRGIGGTISMVTSSAMGFMVLKTFPSLIEKTGLQGTYFLYSIILTYILVVMWFLLPETKGKTLQEIEDTYRGRLSKPYEIEARQSLETSHEIHEIKR